MAVTPVTLTTSGSTTDGTSFVTASITPTANRLVLLGVFVSVSAGTPPALTVTGCGLTWVPVDQTPTSTTRQILLFRAMGVSPTAGAVTIASTDGTTVMTGALWNVTEHDGADTSGTDGSGAIVQSTNARPATATSASRAFSTTVTAGNGAYGVVGVPVQEAPAVGSGWTSQGTTTLTAPVSGLLAEAASVAPQNITASWTTSAVSYVVGAEIKAAPVSVAAPTATVAVDAPAADSVLSVAAPTATVASDAALPAVLLTVDAPAAAVSVAGAVPVPTVTVDAPTVTVTADALVAAAGSAADAPTATVNVDAPAPSTAVSVDAPTATVAADAPTATGGSAADAPTATVTAAAGAADPLIQGPAPVATVTAAAPAPVTSATVTAPTATVSVAALVASPEIQGTPTHTPVTSAVAPDAGFGTQPFGTSPFGGYATTVTAVLLDRTVTAFLTSDGASGATLLDRSVDAVVSVLETV